METEAYRWKAKSADEIIEDVQRMFRVLENPTPTYCGIHIPRAFFRRSSYTSRKRYNWFLSFQSKKLGLPIRELKKFGR